MERNRFSLILVSTPKNRVDIRLDDLKQVLEGSDSIFSTIEI